MIKKSSIDLTDLAIGIVVLGVIVSIGSTILINMRDSRLSSLSTYTNTNESITFSGNTARLSLPGTGTVTVTNQSTGSTVSPGNYTISTATDGTVTVTNLTSTWQNWYATYTAYNTTRSDYTLANKSSLGLGEYGNWFKIIVIVGVAAVILSLIFLAFGKKGQSSQSY